MTNLDKYRKYESIIDKVTTEFCMSFFPNGVPEHTYSLGTNFTKHKYGRFAQEASVTGVKYFLTGDLRKPWFDKRPSKKDVIAIKAISEKIKDIPLDPEYICIHVKNDTGSWAHRYKDIEKFKFSFDRRVMDAELEKANKIYVEKYLVKDGQFACAYCRKATDKDKKITRDIFSRQYSNHRKAFDYCSPECATHDQYAHEG